MSPSQGSYRRGPPSLLRVLAPLVPRPRCYFAALRLPDTLRPRLIFPLPKAYLDGSCFFFAGNHVQARTQSPRRLLLRPSASPARLHRGDVGISRVTGSSFVHAPWSNAPPDTPRPRPLTDAALLPSGGLTPWASGTVLFRGCFLTAHEPARLRFAATVADVVARLASDLPGLALIGRGSHPLDDFSEFLESIATSYPFRPASPGRTRPKHITYVPAQLLGGLKDLDVRVRRHGGAR
jgi:hypothetical protein